MGKRKTEAELRQIFDENYSSMWECFKNRLTEDERAVIILRFGLSGRFLRNHEIAEKFNFSQPQYPSVVLRRGLNKLRKAAMQEYRNSTLIERETDTA